MPLTSCGPFLLSPLDVLTKSKRIPRGLAFALLLAFHMLIPSAQSQSSLPQPHHPASDHEQFVSYWTTETGWHSDLQLRNNLAMQDLTVTPFLRAADGAETPLSPVTIKPQEVKTVDIEAAVMGSAPQLIATYGSVVLRYHSPSLRNLFAMLMIHNLGHSIAYHFDALGEIQDPQAGSREGIWWLPNDTASDYLVLTNQGLNPLQLDLSLYDSSGKEAQNRLVLAAHATSRLSVRQLVRSAGLAGSFGGIKIYTATHSGSLDSLHVLFDEKGLFSALMKMFDQSPTATLDERDFAGTKVWTLRAPMLALSNPDPALAFPEGTTLQPQLFVRNTLGKPVNVNLRFNWRGASSTGKVAGPALSLAPYETRRIDVAALQAANTIPKEANWASVILTTNGLPDEVIAVAASYDQTLQYGAQTPFSDQLAFAWEGSMWEYDVQHNSLITAGNGGTKSVQAAFTIYYNQGTQKYELEQTLQPDDQMWIDVGKLIRQHLPDKNGKLLPADLSSGSYEFRDLSDNGVGSLFEGKVIYDKTYGHVTYGCGGCCAYEYPYLWSNPLGIPLLGGSQNDVYATPSCGGNDVNVNSYFHTWSTANSSIATVNTSGYHSGVGVGSTSTTANGNLLMSGIRNCPLQPQAPGGSDNVNAVPVNFRQTATSDAGNGDLHFAYAWDSSSGYLGDLSACTVGEIVTYPGSNPYNWPSPPFPANSVPNPIVAEGAATAGIGVDDNFLYPSSTFIKPYSAASFTATQNFRYRCTNINNGAYATLLGPLSITRSVQQNTNGTWKFTVTKPTNGQAIINPLP